ncbi:hypothetical protein [Fulvimonas soli]|jgi:hypothetical protein|uniref:hypothetical protein n=1 Tax=Fulvimonas soli TaxID=155197 RepID=UPI001122C1C1|nr:hypothetical protein [Fulvimonas soli]
MDTSRRASVATGGGAPAPLRDWPGTFAVAAALGGPLLPAGSASSIKSLCIGEIFVYPQMLWISLWIGRGQAGVRPVMTAFGTYWSKFSQPKTSFQFNKLR